MSYYQSLAARPPPHQGMPPLNPLMKPPKKMVPRKSSLSKKKKENLMDDSFYNSVQHQLISELVGNIGGDESHNTSTVTVDVKHSESNTTNHSTGDSQNSSSAEKVVRCTTHNEGDEESCSSASSSSSDENGEPTCCVPNESLRSFITDSPFSFRNPIFFSVPRDQQGGNYQKKVNPLASKR